MRQLALAPLAVALVTGTAIAAPPGVVPIHEASPFHAVPPAPGQSPTMPAGAPVQLPPEAPSTRSGDGDVGYTIDRSGFSAHVAADGRITFGDRSVRAGVAGTPNGPAFVTTFDLTDLAMRAHGDDPYLYEKLLILDSTRAERTAMRLRSDERVMRRALGVLPGYLAAIWAYPGWSIEARRGVLFALWDETAERGNELVRQGGAEARDRIEEFIRTALPPGSAHAFTADELAWFNAIRSTEAEFSPYRSAAARAPDPGSLALAPIDPYGAAAGAPGGL